MNDTLVIYTFITTALWDVILRWFAEDKMFHFPKPFNIHEYDFVVALKPYFKKHTLLGAACIAGFVGAFTQYIILTLVDFPHLKLDKNMVTFFIVSFIISAVVGYPMDKSGLFPVLSETYYRKLGRPRSFVADGISGVIVQATLLFLLLVFGRSKHCVNKI